MMIRHFGDVSETFLSLSQIDDLPNRLSILAASDIWYSFVTAPLRHLSKLGDEQAHHPVMLGAALPAGICTVKIALKKHFFAILAKKKKKKGERL